MRHLKRVVIFLLAVAFILSVPTIASADRKSIETDKSSL